MVLEKQNNNIHFSIERFETVMSAAGITWAEINKELNYDAESMLKNKYKPPMPNVINKACVVIGLKNSDYVMMKSNDFNIKDYKSEPEVVKRGRKPIYTQEEKEKIARLIKTHTYKEVSEITNKSVYTIKYIVKNMGVKSNSNTNKGNRYTKEEKDNALKLLETHTYREVSEMTGMALNTLYILKNKKEKENMNIPTKVIEEVKKNDEVVITTEQSQHENNYKPFRNCNKNNYYDNKQDYRSNLRYVADKVDYMTDDELDKLIQYINRLKEIRKLKDTF